MTSLSRLLCFSLILTGAVLVWAPGDTHAQSVDAKSKGTGSISGKVTLGGKAAAGIPVAVIGFDSGNRRAVQATTDNEGRYRLLGLSAAQYLVTALVPSLIPAEGDNNYPFYGANKTVLLSAGESVEDVDLKLVRGAVITGRVTDEEGKPVAEERVELQLADEKVAAQPRLMSTLSMNYQMLQTDDRGIYRLYGLSAGRYKVSVGTNPNGGFSSNGARGYFPQTFYPDTVDATKAAVVEISEGGEAANIDIRLGHRSATFSISGRVVDSESGQPIPGIRPTYGRISKENPNSGAYLGGLPTNSTGEFRFDGLEPGHYTLFASSRFDGGDFYSDPIVFDIVDHNVSDLELKAIRGLTISGFVVPDSDSSKNALSQLGGLRITANVRTNSNPGTNSSGWAIVAADGSFRISGMAPGKVTLYLYSPEKPNSRRFSLTRIDRDGVNYQPRLGFDLQAGESISNLRVFVSYGNGVIRGTVKFENGSLPSDTLMSVGLQRQGGQVDRGAQTDTRGRFVITDIPPGDYEVILSMRSTAPMPQPPPRPRAPLKQFVTVTDDAEVEVTFTVDLKPKEGGP